MWEEEPHRQWVQMWPSAEEWGRPVIGHRRLQLDAGEGIPEKRREEWFEWFSGGVLSAALWLQTAPTWTPMAQPLSSGPGGGRGHGGEPERGAVRKAS